MSEREIERERYTQREETKYVFLYERIFFSTLILPRHLSPSAVFPVSSRSFTFMFLFTLVRYSISCELHKNYIEARAIIYIKRYFSIPSV